MTERSPRSKAEAWLLASRPKTLPAAATPVLVGTAVAWSMDAHALVPALAALFGALAIQVGTNFANDLLDYRRGADDGERLGPLRLVQSGAISEREMLAGTLAAFLVATSAGVYLTLVAGWPVIVIGVASIAAGIAYTGGPFPLAYNGLGDVFVLVFFGFVAVCGTVYVQALRVGELAWWTGGLVGVLATAILVVNNVRDVETDRAAGKRTLAVLFSRRFGQVEYAILVGLAYLIPALVFRRGLAGIWVLACVLTFPLGRRLVRVVGRATDGATLNRALAGTALLLLIHGLLFSAGLVADRLLTR